MRIVSSSPRITRFLAATLARELALHPPFLPYATVLALQGPLGSGKTSFAQGLARTLGATRNLPSPTFTLVRRYAITRGRYRRFFHVDAYRLRSGSTKALAPLGIAEALADPRNLIVVEWADRIRAALPPRYLRIAFRHTRTSAPSRTLTFRSI